VLDDLLNLFRRRPASVRRRAVAGESRWRIDLATMGGLIGFSRSDHMPRSGLRMKQPKQAKPPAQPKQPRRYRDDDEVAAQAYAQANGYPQPTQDQQTDWQAAQSYNQHGEQPYTENAEPPYTPHAEQYPAQAERYVPQEQNFNGAAQWREPEDERPQPAVQQGYLAAHAVEKSFANRKVVKGASLYVRRGEAVGLLGPNGAGKTTIFYMITGLIQADRGRIELDGHDVTALPMYQRARLGIGYLPQEASIFRGLTVEENIRAVLEVVEPNKRRRERDLNALLQEFNIEKLRKTPSIALSGGERRRCEIARALASRPNYMLLDEPFAGIDPIAVGDLQILVRHLTNRGIGVLITDHNVRETLGLTDRAYIIYSGEVLMEGRTDDIVNNPEVRRLYLGEEFRL
jgi:lipopolysaccharide export system ATP-binding protein